MTRTVRMGLLAGLAVLLALMAYSRIRELGYSPAVAGQSPRATEEEGERLVLTRRTSDAFKWSTFVRAVDGSGEKQLTSGPRDTLLSFSPQR